MFSNETGDTKSGFEQICTILCQMEDPQQMGAFLEEILTPAERKDLSLRWELMRMLKQGVPQRQIASQLGISLCKITRGAKILKQEESISKQYLDSGDTHGPKNPTE
ncbi:MAG: Trp family transcriptional regulator [Planctomycetota bacterium]|jgi:TrpR family trp operon transcriptional repressor